MDLDLGGLGVLVAEPERYDGGLDSGVEKCHRAGVAERVQGDGLDGDRLVTGGGSRNMFGYEVWGGWVLTVTAREGFSVTLAC